MENINSILVQHCANQFFGTENFLETNILEATLRFIALKHCDGDIEKISPLIVANGSFDGYTSGNEYVNIDIKSNISIYIGRNSVEPLTITREGWIALDKPPFPVSLFLSKISSTTVFVNKELKRAIIFVKRATPNWLDALSSSLFRILEWIYEDDTKISDEEKALFKAIHEQNLQLVTELMDKAAEKIDFKGYTEKKMLYGWTTGMRQAQINSLEAESQRVKKDIVDYEKAVAEKYDKLAILCENINALSNLPEGEDEEFYKFFKRHSQLSIYRVDVNRNNGGKMLFYQILDTLEFYDVDEFDRMYNNKTSILYTNTHSSDELREFFYNIFKLEKGRIRVNSIFKLQNLSSITPAQGIDVETTPNSIRHPHLYHFGCLGGNQTYIQNYMAEGNWDLAIEQTIAATKNINFGDTTVFGKFICDIRDRFSDKIVAVDGKEDMSPYEFLEYVRTSENKE